jgi:hypothetical protein
VGRNKGKGFTSFTWPDECESWKSGFWDPAGSLWRWSEPLDPEELFFLGKIVILKRALNNYVTHDNFATGQLTERKSKSREKLGTLSDNKERLVTNPKFEDFKNHF